MTRRRNGRTVGFNAKHFIREHRLFLSQGTPHSGIILVPDTGPVTRLAVRTALLLDWIGTQEHHSRVFRWGALQTLLTQGYRLPGYSEEEVQYALGQS